MPEETARLGWAEGEVTFIISARMGLDLRMFQFPRMRHVAGIERAYLAALQCEQCNRVAIVANELHLERHPAAMHQHGSAHVATQQRAPVQISRRGDNGWRKRIVPPHNEMAAVRAVKGPGPVTKSS